MHKKKMIELCDDRHCTACGACVQICPKKAVQFQEDSFGNQFPGIDPNLCVSCGLCRKSCPILSPQKRNDVLSCYAAWAKDENDRNGSSSGGVAYLFGKQILHDGGIVFGCRLTDDGAAELFKVESLEQLELTRRSKYLKSTTGNTFQETKVLLENGCKVLWIGIPCQIAGLYGFLKIKPPNLVTVDLICHGTPPAKYWKEYQKVLSSGHSSFSCIFRDNIHGFVLQSYEKRILTRKRHWLQDPYYYAFMYGIDYCEKCYSCPFASPQRIGDLTIGDFWGLNKKDCPNSPSFPSIVLVNTERGKDFLQRAEMGLAMQERSIEEGLSGNAQLQKATVRHPLRERFLQNYYLYGFNGALDKTGISRICKKHRIIFLLKVPFRMLRDLARRRKNA